jgi:ArsR family transcriptional regulator, lead/cadmium/zinc/bismuth-responsive transcriptional repressor
VPAALPLAVSGVVAEFGGAPPEYTPTLVRLSAMATDSCDLLCLDLEAAEDVRTSLDRERIEVLASTMRMFADPTRLLIVHALARRELCGCDLGWICGQSDKVISHHVGRLKHEGLVVSRREGKVVFASLTERGRTLLTAIDAVAA